MNQYGNGYYQYGNGNANMGYNAPPVGQPQPQSQVNNNQMQSYSIPSSNCNFIMAKNANQVFDYVLGPDSKVYFMETNRPIMYLKTTNAFGLSDVKAYKFEEVDVEKLKNPQYDIEGSTDVVTREEFSALMQEVLAIKDEIRENNKIRNNNQRNNDRKGGRDESSNSTKK